VTTSPTERFEYVEADPLLGSEARAILLIGTIRRFAPVRLAFAWTRNNRVPVILGQTNFFMEFDIRFCRSERFFEITPRGKVGG
jgi:hypothetical protein